MPLVFLKPQLITSRKATLTLKPNPCTDGVSKKTESFKIIRGEFALNELMDDIHQTLSNNQSDILISFVDGSLATRVTTQKLFRHIDFLKDKNIDQRVLCFPGSKSILSPTETCRWVNEDCKNVATTTFVYGDKVAHELWNKNIIIVTHSIDAANAERRRFEHLWQSAMIPEENSSNVERIMQGN